MEPPDFNDDFYCCRAQDDHDESMMGLSSMETLSYVPVRFDVSSTIDNDRSQARYSTIVVHSSRARTQRRSKAWAEWLRVAIGGRKCTVLVGSGFHTPRSGGDSSQG